MEKIDDTRPSEAEELDVRGEFRDLKSKLNELVDWINNIENIKREFMETFKADREATNVRLAQKRIKKGDLNNGHA